MKTMKRPMLITFEGIEGCGKSTQAIRLAARFNKEGVPCVHTLEPGGTPVGQQIRQILLDARNQDLPPLSELFLYEADRALHVARTVQPALAAGKWVICDRFFDATTVYQGYGRGLDREMILLLNQKASAGITPDVTFLIDCPVEVGLRRASKRDQAAPARGLDRFEKEALTFHQAVRQGYLALARQEPSRFVVLDGEGAVEQLEKDIWARIFPFLSDMRE